MDGEEGEEIDALVATPVEYEVELEKSESKLIGVALRLAELLVIELSFARGGDLDSSRLSPSLTPFPSFPVIFRVLDFNVIIYPSG